MTSGGNQYVAPSAGIQFVVEMGTRNKFFTVDLSAMNHQQLIEAAAQVLEMAPGVTFDLEGHSPLANLDGKVMEIANDRDLEQLIIHAQNCLAMGSFTVVLKVINFTAPAAAATTLATSPAVTAAAVISPAFAAAAVAPTTLSVFSPAAVADVSPAIDTAAAATTRADASPARAEVSPGASPAVATTTGAGAAHAAATAADASPADATAAIAATTRADASPATTADASPTGAAAVAAATRVDASPAAATTAAASPAGPVTAAGPSTPPAAMQEAEMQPPDEHDLTPVTINARKRGRAIPNLDYDINNGNIVETKRARVICKRPPGMEASDGPALDAAVRDDKKLW